MTYPWWSLLPFAAMLACIAVLPILNPTATWWEDRRHQLLIAAALGIPVAIWMTLRSGTGPILTTAVDYLQFIALLFALFVVSGGIHLAGDIEAKPETNTAFLAVGGVLASLVGTTGAAMLLIRPILATNRERTYRVHTVLFTIFIVANCGGLLTPLGDPPLFLGFLHGVPFTWTLGLWPQWLFVLVLLLVSYYALDLMYFASEPVSSRVSDRSEVTALRLDGKINLIFFAVIVAAVAFVPSVDAEAVGAGHASGWELVPWREIVMMAAVAASLLLGSREVRYRDNAFTWAPIAEVATLFFGIFLTMAPALRYLEQIAPSLPLGRETLFLFTGGLSSVLDNAPTYLTFFEMAKTLDVPGPTVAGVPEVYLVSISLGAVVCGAMTYIGNGPNFMVKSVAEAEGVPMPSFGRYIVDASVLLAPTLAAMAFLFVFEGALWRSLGAAITLGILGVAAMRIWRVRGGRPVVHSR